ncbi:MAG: hypothetical protein A2Y24_03030 [Clostridiales bacterium GWE2_32_10]|nr:MAG: hypothetical protein A2Y24_03030 [Clostridiales bacterium GWE2_32_10]HBY20128.1 hypothetical protein [Clostridiales bacterium]
MNEIVNIIIGISMLLMILGFPISLNSKKVLKYMPAIYFFILAITILSWIYFSTILTPNNDHQYSGLAIYFTLPFFWLSTLLLDIAIVHNKYEIQQGVMNYILKLISIIISNVIIFFVTMLMSNVVIQSMEDNIQNRMMIITILLLITMTLFEILFVKVDFIIIKYLKNREV